MSTEVATLIQRGSCVCVLIVMANPPPPPGSPNLVEVQLSHCKYEAAHHVLIQNCPKRIGGGGVGTDRLAESLCSLQVCKHA